MRKDVPPIPWVNVLTLLILVSGPAGKLEAASYEVEPFYGSSLWREKDSGIIQHDWNVAVTSNDVYEFRGVYWFELPPMAGTIVSAQWQFVPFVETVGLFGFSTFSIYDVDGQYDQRDASFGRFSDLGTGKLYGQQNIFEADHNNVMTLSLSADAVDELNAARAGTDPFRAGCTVASGFIHLSRFDEDTTVWRHVPKLILETEAAPEPVVLSGLDLAGDTLTVTIRNIPDGQAVHLRQSTDLVTFEPLSPSLNITGTDSPQTLPITLGTTPRARLFLRVDEGASP